MSQAPTLPYKKICHGLLNGVCSVGECNLSKQFSIMEMHMTLRKTLILIYLFVFSHFITMLTPAKENLQQQLLHQLLHHILVMRWQRYVF